jgi:hypothetical protein
MFALFATTLDCLAAPIKFARPATPEHPKVIIVTPGLPDNIWLYRDAHLHTLIPLFGAVAATKELATDDSRKAQLRNALVAAGLDVQGQLHADLWSALRAVGYDAIPAKVARTVKHGKSVELEASEIPDSEDAFAILDVIVLHYGFYGVDTLTNIQPGLAVKLRLIAADRHTLLIEKVVSWNAMWDTLSSVERVIPKVTPRRWKDVDDVEAHAADAVESLRVASNELAAAIASQL